jgi:uncharacterized protein YbcI
MSDNSHGSDFVREIRRLLIKNGFNEDQVDLIMEKLRSEVTQTGEAQDPELMRVTLCQRLAHFITTMKLGHNAPPAIFKAHYDEIYLIIVSLLTIAIYDNASRIV